MFENLDPIVIRIVDKVETHAFILEAYTAHLSMILSYSIIIPFHSHGKVALVLAKFIRLRMIAQSGKQSPKRGLNR